MSRGFGATLGAGATDRITPALTSTATQRSYAIWTNRNGNGGGGYGRMIDQDSKVIIYDDSDGAGSGLGSPCYAVLVLWTTTAGSWTIARPSASAPHFIGVSYDAGTVTNDPVCYVDGSSVTVTQVGVNPSGSAPSGTAAIRVGNTLASDRAWNGLLAEFAVWDRILSATEFARLAAGWSPMTMPTSLVEYVPLLNANLSRVLAAPTITGTAVVLPHPAVGTGRLLSASRNQRAA